jgi:hypothetical protein
MLRLNMRLLALLQIVFFADDRHVAERQNTDVSSAGMQQRRVWLFCRIAAKRDLLLFSKKTGRRGFRQPLRAQWQ